MTSAGVLTTAKVMRDDRERGGSVGFGLKLAVVLVGTPLADRLMALLKPPLTVVVMVELPWAPCATMTEVGAALMVKLGGAVTEIGRASCRGRAQTLAVAVTL